MSDIPQWAVEKILRGEDAGLGLSFERREEVLRQRIRELEGALEKITTSEADWSIAYDIAVTALQNSELIR